MGWLMNGSCPVEVVYDIVNMVFAELTGYSHLDKCKNAKSTEVYGISNEATPNKDYKFPSDELKKKHGDRIHIMTP